jgi:hypothetical protein
MARVRASLKDTDRGYRDMMRQLEIKKSKVDVGVFQGEGAKAYGTSGATVIDVAVWNEFGTFRADGTPHIPERSFIRRYFDSQQARITGFALAEMQKFIRRKQTKTQALHRIGLRIQGEIQQGITVGFMGAYPENAPRTIEWKGSETPLIGLTGQLRSSISYRVKLR